MPLRRLRQGLDVRRRWRIARGGEQSVRALIECLAGIVGCGEDGGEKLTPSEWPFESAEDLFMRTQDETEIVFLKEASSNVGAEQESGAPRFIWERAVD